MLELWKATPALMSLLPKPPQSGQLKGPQQAPYGQISCAFVSDERMTGGIRYDNREVAFTVRGSKAEVVAAIAAIALVFNTDLGQPNHPTLTFDAPTTRLFWFRPKSWGTLRQITGPEGTKAGDDFWEGVWDGELRTVRLR